MLPEGQSGRETDNIKELLVDVAQYTNYKRSNCEHITRVIFRFPNYSLMNDILGTNAIDVIFGSCPGNCDQKCDLGSIEDSMKNGFQLKTINFPKEVIALDDFVRGMILYDTGSGNTYLAKEILRIDTFD